MLLRDEFWPLSLYATFNVSKQPWCFLSLLNVKIKQTTVGSQVSIGCHGATAYFSRTDILTKIRKQIITPIHVKQEKWVSRISLLIWSKQKAGWIEMFTTSGTEELFKSFQRNEPTIFNYCNHAAPDVHILSSWVQSLLRAVINAQKRTCTNMHKRYQIKFKRTSSTTKSPTYLCPIVLICVDWFWLAPMAFEPPFHGFSCRPVAITSRKCKPCFLYVYVLDNISLHLPSGVKRIYFNCSSYRK